jgi:peptidyl-prolyl cis-trans isomerase C
MERHPEPGWACTAPDGMRSCLEVYKNGKLLHHVHLWPKDPNCHHVEWFEGAKALLIGRWGGSDMVCEHPSVSRQHAWLGWNSDGRLVLQDLESAAGTQINGKRVGQTDPAPLSDGDTIDFAESSRRYTVRERRKAQNPPLPTEEGTRSGVGEGAGAVDSSPPPAQTGEGSREVRKRKKKEKKHKKKKRKKDKSGRHNSLEDDSLDDSTVYTRSTASHILLGEKDDAWDILAELEAGGDFATLARKHSKCPSGKGNGGCLGSFGPGKMVPEFDAIAFSGMHALEQVRAVDGGMSSRDNVRSD